MSSLQVQTLPVKTLTPSILPTIRIRSASPDFVPSQKLLQTSLRNIQIASKSTVRRHNRVQRREGLRSSTRRPSALPSHMVREIKQSKASKDKQLQKQKQRENGLQGQEQRLQQQEEQEQEQEQEEEGREHSTETNMPPRSSRRMSLANSSSPEPSASSSTSANKTKPTAKDADWSDVTDPEERRRIQNRIAQRKFREKARENKEKAEREMRNQEHAGNSYRIPTAEDFINDDDSWSSGTPWGSINFGHVVSRGHEAESRRSSGRGSYVGGGLDTGGSGSGFQSLASPPPGPAPAVTFALTAPPYGSGAFVGHPQGPASCYGSSVGEEAYMPDETGYYSPVMTGFNPLPPQ